MDNFNVYKDISARTDGDIYIGVVGPVRTGKSTFIKRFMDLLVIPNITDEHEKQLAIDELPQSAAGRTIMTTEPKFIPKNGVSIEMEDEISFKVRMIDCVGYLVHSAVGHMENDQERLVKTPWYEYEIPFTKAAEVGTKKVITDHSTIGIVVTTDGSFTDISREDYEEPEERTIAELRELKKPFIVLLNSNRPYSKETRELAEAMEEKYQVPVKALNCEQLKTEDIKDILKQILLEFPINCMEFFFPKWLEALPMEHWLKKELFQWMKNNFNHLQWLKDLYKKELPKMEMMSDIKLDKVGMDTGKVKFQVSMKEPYYYQVLSELTGMNIDSEYELIQMLRELSKGKGEFDKVSDAITAVRYKGYGIVTPQKNEIHLDTPELVKHGSKYGVKIRATAPSIHMIKADITTELAPIVGSEQQAQDLIQYIKEESENGEEGIWKVNIFGKSVEQLVEDGMMQKAAKMTEESQMKLQDTMEKIINDGNGGLVCIII